MKIIDAHIHFAPFPGFDSLAQQAGHENSATYLRRAYAEQGILHAVVMGNRGLSLEEHEYPGFMSYCIGLSRDGLRNNSLAESLPLVEQHLRRKNCVGIKLYPGYNPQYVYDPEYFPYYELAEHCGKPVAVHTGSTASGMGRLRHCHPLTLDEVAVQFPRVQFIMCHFGNPFVTEAAAVLSKNRNVAADLSGMLEGRLDMVAFCREQEGYLNHLRTWIRYLGDYDRLLYGTDWPLVNMQNYLDFIAMLIPPQYLPEVLFDNANRLYRLGL